MGTLKLVQVTPESLAEIVKNAVSSELERFSDLFNPNSAIEKKEYFSILISNCVAVEKNKR